jgi:hypothetical protein
MDAFHERLARVGLSVLADYGFALAGGYAVQAHGLVERPSEDVDLFATLAAEKAFPDAVRAAVDAYVADGLDVEVVIDNRGFARLTVSDPVGPRASKVEMGVDWRRDSPTQLAIGPVLSRDDAVANKVGALYSRGRPATTSTSTPPSPPAVTPGTTCWPLAELWSLACSSGPTTWPASSRHRPDHTRAEPSRNREAATPHRSRRRKLTAASPSTSAHHTAAHAR